MRALLLTLTAISAFALPQSPTPQITLHSGTDTSLRGLSSSNNGKILYATGSNSTILRSPDSGKTWTALHIDSTEKQDFRGVQSFGADIAYVFSVGNENKSHIYKTTDAGATWNVRYSDPRPAFFLDALACRTEKNCFAISDPIDGKFPILHTEDGEHWTELPKDTEPAALPTEGLFAASNSSLILCGPNKSDILFATGGPAARVFHSADNARTWTVATTLILHGTASAGIFSIACIGPTVIAVGGDYQNPSIPQTSIVYSDDFGVTWRIPKKSTEAYRSAVIAVPSKIATIWLAVGPTGSDISIDNGVHWAPFSHENTNAAIAVANNRVLTAGPKGFIGQILISPDALQH
jgi:photosystem II stability/assembly factor-like uncharacterized protein